jgi:hypothetical protein
MNRYLTKTPHLHRAAISVVIIVMLLSSQACTISLFDIPWFSQTPSTPQPGQTEPPATPVTVAQVNFSVQIPAPLLPGQSLAISILDEVTGLALNAVNYTLQPKDTQTYSISLPLPLNSVTKYRYLLIGNNQLPEVTSVATPVRYRLFHVAGPSDVHDIVSSWAGQPFNGQTGSIQGEIKDRTNSAPIPNLMVAAGGVLSLTDSTGRFHLVGLPPGEHNLVAYALDGSYRTFQQGASVAAGLVTPVNLALDPAPRVNVILTVSVPKTTVPGAPVRVAGNLSSLGNTFADLDGGMNTVADRMPTMTMLPDGRYTVTLNLPVGADLHYKYTLGDGFWNAEHKGSGEFRVRELIVPGSDTSIQDTIDTWEAGSSAPILFEVTVPSNTPAGDVVYIQFNPYGWTQPIPMWSLGNNHWAYKLYGPLNFLGNFGYRYCRNGQCGSADDVATAGNANPGRSVSTSLTPQDIQDTVTGWSWLQSTGANQLVAAQINPRPGSFVAGVEFQPTFRPSWISMIPQALQNVQALSSNWMVLTPTWTFRLSNPLIFSPLPGRDPLWPDAGSMAVQARNQNMNVAIFPVPNFPTDSTAWWSNAPRDEGWWTNWFDSYREFAVNYADLATQTGAQAVILGGDWIGPALPGGQVNGENSGVPSDAETRWRVILDDVRSHFKGQVWWALPYTPGSLQSAPGFLAEMDSIYLLWEAPLSDQLVPSNEALVNEAGRLLDAEILPFEETLQKPVVIAMAAPSIIGSATNCPPDGIGGCLDWMALSQPSPDVATVTLDLQAQVDVYQAMLTAINTRPWVNGFVSRGYYPPTILQDKSASVHGKPAADLLWYWFPRMLGIIK